MNKCSEESKVIFSAPDVHIQMQDPLIYPYIWRMTACTKMPGLVHIPLKLEGLALSTSKLKCIIFEKEHKYFTGRSEPRINQN